MISEELNKVWNCKFIITENNLEILVDMSARGNKLSYCKVSGKYSDVKESYQTFRTLRT